MTELDYIPKKTNPNFWIALIAITLIMLLIVVVYIINREVKVDEYPFENHSELKVDDYMNDSYLIIQDSVYKSIRLKKTD